MMGKSIGNAEQFKSANENICCGERIDILCTAENLKKDEQDLGLYIVNYKRRM